MEKRAMLQWNKYVRNVRSGWIMSPNSNYFLLRNTQIRKAKKKKKDTKHGLTNQLKYKI